MLVTVMGGVMLSLRSSLPSHLISKSMFILFQSETPDPLTEAVVIALWTEES